MSAYLPISKKDILLQTAGLVLANRLSEDGDHTVLVLEAGAAHIDDLNVCPLPSHPLRDRTPRRSPVRPQTCPPTTARYLATQSTTGLSAPYAVLPSPPP